MTNLLAVGGPGSKYKLPGARPAGFLAGLWHGLICPLTFLVSLFSPDVRMYEVDNNGLWYDFGFILGASSTLGGGGSAANAP